MPQSGDCSHESCPTSFPLPPSPKPGSANFPARYPFKMISTDIIHPDEDKWPSIALSSMFLARVALPRPPWTNFQLAQAKSKFDWHGFTVLLLLSISLLGIVYFMFARP